MGLFCSPFSFRRRRGLWIFWGISLLMVLMILYIIYHFSAQGSIDSSQLSQGICARIFRFIGRFYPKLLEKQSIWDAIEIMETPVRKLAHFMEYTCLSFVMQIHFEGIWQLELFHVKEKMTRRNLSMLALILCVLYSISDEIHQYFVPGRACRFFDICVDSAGVILGVILFWAILRRLLDGLFLKVYNEKN